MKQKYILVFSLVFFSFSLFSQDFYHTGSTDDIETDPLFGILLAGGGGDNDQGMAWLAARANGGDVVVLRASGSDGYNNYIYSQLGTEVNSVTSIVITSSEQADSEAVCEAVENAELIFIAGGNQWNYYNHWKGTCLHDLINAHVNVKSAPIGGTSAGLAVLGEVVFTAENQSVWSDEALGDPYHFRVMLANDFLQVPFMENVVTDSHYNAVYDDDNNRHGRHTAFLARMIADWQMNARGIGVNEYTAVAVDENGLARVFGDPSYFDHAYFLLANAEPDTCLSGKPLHWMNETNALSVYRVRGNNEGSNTFNLINWQEGDGGEWFRWYVDNGQLTQVEADYLDATFWVTDSSSDPIEDAGIHLGGLINLSTNTAGQAYFANALQDYAYSYVIEKEGYDPLSGQLSITQAGQEFSFILDVSTSVTGQINVLPAPEVGPNPAQSHVKVKAPRGSMITGFRMADVSGRTIVNEKRPAAESLEISLAGLAPGFYLLMIDTGTDTFTFRIVKK